MSSSLTGYNPATISDAFSSGSYRHVALSISGTTHTLYLDGSPVAVNSNAGNIFSIYTSAISNLYIGCAADLSYGYTGIIDDFRIWNRALPASDILSIYSQPGYYRLPINTLSTTAYNAMVYSGTGSVLQSGAFGTTLLLSSAVNNPVIQIKKDTIGTPTNFYAPINGTKNLTTGVNGTGTGIVAFLNGDIGYVTKWYDQTGNGHDASGCTTNSSFTHLPFLNTSTYVVDFSINGYFILPDNSFPTGNLPYSYVYKQGSYNVNTGKTVCSGGTESDNPYRQMTILMLDFAEGKYTDSWFYIPNDSGGVTTQNAVTAFTYNVNVGKLLYVNYTLTTLAGPGSFATDTSRNQSIYNCRLGHSHIYENNWPTYQSTMPYFYWMPYQLDLSNIKILGTTGVYNLPLIPNLYSGLILWLDANDSSTVSVIDSTWSDKSGQNNHLSREISGAEAAITYYDTSANIGKPSVYFNASPYTTNPIRTNYLRTTASINNMPITYFVVFYSLSTNSGQMRGLLIGEPISQSNGIGINNLNRLAVIYDNTTSGSTSFYDEQSVYGFPAALTLLTIQISGGSTSKTFNKVLINLNGTNRVNSTLSTTYYTKPSIYSYIRTYAGEFYICENLLYNSVLSEPEYKKVEGYLAWKWGIQSKLPDTHTYKTSDPTAQ